MVRYENIFGTANIKDLLCGRGLAADLSVQNGAEIKEERGKVILPSKMYGTVFLFVCVFQNHKI